jgi:hypothetical protein
MVLMVEARFEHALEEQMVALNEWLYAEAVGLEAPAEAGNTLGARLADLYAEALAADGPGRSYWVDSWAEARRVPGENALTRAMDTVLSVPELGSSAGPLTWRNWKVYEREAAEASSLETAFEALVERSEGLVPWLAQSLAQLRAGYGRYGLTPIHTFAEREGLSLKALHRLLETVGRACREPFQAALGPMSEAVFGRPAGPAELRALYLNRMYEPNAGRFAAEDAVPQALNAFAAMGFDLSRIPVDVEQRPRKYPGAFCFPVRTPGDVRVSVRIASAHHLVDMLYHELGHAVHFTGIAPQCSFLGRYWITSGTHETFSTLFELLLSEPLYLQERFAFDAAATQALAAFAHFKDLLNAAWLGAAALTAMEAWLEALAWREIEQRYAAHMLDFTGVAMPPGFARLESFTANASFYPAGYLLAAARAAHWRQHLRGLGGAAWWRSPAAQADIEARVRAGGVGMFPTRWNGPDAFLAVARTPSIIGPAP